MTAYKTKIQYVSWNEQVKGSVKKAETKKTKLENQGYNLIHSECGLFTGLMVYKNENFNKEGKK